MSESPRYVTLRDYLRVLRTHRFLIVVLTLAFAGVALALSLRQPPTYRAEALLSFAPPSKDADLVGTPLSTTQTDQERAAISADSIKRLSIAQAVKRQLHMSLSPTAIQGHISSAPEVQTNLVVVGATWDSAGFATNLANAYARNVVQTAAAGQRARLQTVIAGLKRSLSGSSKTNPAGIVSRSNVQEQIARLQALKTFTRPVDVVQFATAPSTPISPRPVRNTILGLVAGLTLGILAAFFRDALDRRLRGVDEVSDRLGLPLLGYVSRQAMGRAGLASNGRGPLSQPDLEAFRILRRNIEFLDVDSRFRKILVTSPLPEEGKSTVAASLAYAYAVSGKRALLLECDLRRPSLSHRLSVPPEPGLSDYLAGTTLDVIRAIPIGAPLAAGGNGSDAEYAGELSFVPAGTPTPRPAEMLGSKRFRSNLDSVSERFDVVIIDAPPLLSVVDALELIPQADAVLLCVRASRTTREQAAAAKAALDRSPARPSGVVVTGLRPGEGPDYGSYSYSYAYARQKAAT